MQAYIEDSLIVGACMACERDNHFIGEVPQKTCGPGQDLRYLEGNIVPASCQRPASETRCEPPPRRVALMLFGADLRKTPSL